MNTAYRHNWPRAMARLTPPFMRNGALKSQRCLENTFQDIPQISSGPRRKLQLSETSEAPRKICLFVGQDATALSILNNLIPKLRSYGLEPVIFSVEPNPSPKSEAQHRDIQRIRDYQTRPLEIVQSYLKDQGLIPPADDGKRPAVTLEYFEETFGIKPKLIPAKKVNDPDFIRAIIEDEKLVGALSIRPYQYFKNEIISAFEGKKFDTEEAADISGFFWNLHPGMLPRMRGIHTPIIAMSKRKEHFGWSLHEVHFDKDEAYQGIDFGDFIDITTAPIDYSQHALSLYFNFAVQGAELIAQKVGRLHHHGEVPDIKPQASMIDRLKDEGNNGSTAYYSYQEAVEAIESAWGQGAELPPIADPWQTAKFYAETFISENMPEHREALENLIGTALDTYDRDGIFPIYQDVLAQFPVTDGFRASL